MYVRNKKKKKQLSGSQISEEKNKLYTSTQPEKQEKPEGTMLLENHDALSSLKPGGVVIHMTRLAIDG